ncbi:B12-binding domain-containing radical SAM protein [Acidobacteriota bacterium]
MRVALVNPPSSFEQLYGEWDLSALDTYCPPLGILYISSFLRQHGHEVFLVDIASLKLTENESIEFIFSLDPDVVGLSSMTINVSNANKIAEKIKCRNPAIPVVIGGPHLTAAPIETLSKYGSIDFGVIGEGEETFLALIQAIDKDKAYSSVRGIIWRDKDENLIVNPARPLIEDLDSLPFPAWDLLSNFPDAYPHNALETKRLPAASIITSRGCPHQCTFCDRSVFGSKVRHHSAAYTIEMIEHLKEQYGIRDLMILDDNFLLNREKLFEICDVIIKECLDLSWYCLGHVRHMTDDRLQRIREAGCWIMEVGIESGSQGILDFLKRNTPKELIAEAITKAKNAGIRVKGNFIFGLPNETKDTLEETIKFAQSLDLSFFQQTFLTVWPGCELAASIENYGHVERNWEKIGHFQISFVPLGLSKTDLLDASKRAFRKFYLRPKIILGMVFSLRSFRTMKSLLLGFIIFMRSILRKQKL